MGLPAFFGHKRSINLLPRDDFEASTLGVILAWALVFGKWSVIITQLIVMGTFLWRFQLDRELTDLRRSIAKEVAVIKSYETVERDFVLAQKQLTQIGQVLADQEKIRQSLKEIELITPNEVWYDRITISPAEVNLTAYAATLPGFGQFINRIQVSPIFSQVRVGEIESSNARGSQIKFDVLMGINKK